MSEWMPIETAPKDGTEILGFEPGWKVGIIAGICWDKDRWHGGPGWTWARLKNADESNNCDPTHWMALPEPPK